DVAPDLLEVRLHRFAIGHLWDRHANAGRAQALADDRVPGDFATEIIPRAAVFAVSAGVVAEHRRDLDALAAEQCADLLDVRRCDAQVAGVAGSAVLVGASTAQVDAVVAEFSSVVGEVLVAPLWRHAQGPEA